jgi:hypothetical protein
MCLSLTPGIYSSRNALIPISAIRRRCLTDRIWRAPMSVNSSPRQRVEWLDASSVQSATLPSSARNNICSLTTDVETMTWPKSTPFLLMGGSIVNTSALGIPAACPINFATNIVGIGINNLSNHKKSKFSSSIIDRLVMISRPRQYAPLV